MTTPVRTIQDVVTDFLGSAPTLAEIAAYRLPAELQNRAHQLLDQNRAGMLTPDERDEMNDFKQMDHLMMLVKAKARLKLQAQERKAEGT